jgi:hypothetical protein
MDLEMVFDERYHEVPNLIDEMCLFILLVIKERGLSFFSSSIAKKALSIPYRLT